MSAATDRPRRLTPGDVDALAAGAALLGSGGGGAVEVGQRLLRHTLGPQGVALVPVTDLAPDDIVVHVGVVGGPDVIAERLVGADDLTGAARAVADTADGRLDAIGCIEVGGLNALMAVVAAASLDVPLVDGDLMGRAFPSIRMTTLALAGHGVTPLALVSPHGDVIVIRQAPVSRAEAVMAAVLRATGGAAAVGLFRATAAELAAASVRGSVSTCRRLGGDFLDAPAGSAATRVRALGGRLLVEGRVEEIRSRGRSGPGTLALYDEHTETSARVDYLDEFLAVSLDGRSVACTPEVLIALDVSSGTPLRSDEVRVGQSLAVCALAALHAWESAALAVVGPAGFGLELEPT